MAAPLIFPDSMKTNVSRPDGRPEAYDIPPGTHMVCEISVANGLDGVFPAGEIVMVSPIDTSDGEAHFVHISHLPDNVVILNPQTNICRNKDGSETWSEGK